MRFLLVLAVCLSSVGASKQLEQTKNEKDDPCGCYDNETCCGDDDLAVCCIDEVTECAPKTDSYPTYPDRCCPRWTVGCSVGSVGCCDPAHPWNREQPVPGVDMSSDVPLKDSSTVAVDTELHALFAQGAFTETIHIHTFDVQGNQKRQTKVTGPAVAWYKEYFSESTRLFAFSPISGTFYYIEVTVNQHVTSGLRLIAIDAFNGSSTVGAIQLPQDATDVGDLRATMYPTSFSYDAIKKQLIFAVTTVDRDQKVTFYTLREGSFRAESLCRLTRGSSEEDSSHYAGYITTAQNGTFYRLGYKYETIEKEGGYLATRCTGVSGNAAWTALNASRLPQNGQMYASLDTIPSTRDFVSLLPTAGGYHLYSWKPTAQSKALLLTKFNSTYAPRAPGLGTLGYIGTGAIGDCFHGLAWGSPKWNKEKWVVMTYCSNGLASVRELQPAVRDASLSGFGATLSK